MSWIILFKKQLFDLEVKVPWRSLQYATHHLMVMHPHTKYHWPIEKQKCYDPDKKILFKKQLFDLDCQSLTKVITVCNIPPYGHAPTYQISLTYLERQKSYGPDKKILFKKQLFDLEVKGQGHTKVITACDIPPYGHALTYQISLTYLERQKCYDPDKKILFKKQLFDLEVKVPRRSLRYATYHLMVMHPHTKYHWPISKDKKSYGPDKKILFKKQLFDLEVKGQGHTKVITVCDIPPYGHALTYQISLTYLERQKCYDPDKKILFKKQIFDLEVKVSRRSLRYATYHLMVVHPHTKYHWPISKDKNVMARTRKYYLKNNYLTLRSKVKVPRRSLRYATYHLMVMHPHTKYHWPISKEKNVMTQTRKYYLKNNYLTLRSKSHEGYYGMQHTTLWSCTNIPNIIDLSGKTKMLWPGQENTI